MRSGRGAYAVLWKDAPRWDIKTAKAALFRVTHPSFRPLADFAEEATELVRPMDEPDHIWPVYGVSNVDGVFLSKLQEGSEFRSPYKRIRKDWFFHNPTRANVGSLGRVPEVPSDAITSPEYQVWRLRGDLLPEYVEILIATQFFLNLVQCHRVGAVKERLYVSNLLEIPVPDVTLEQQKSIVSATEEAWAAIAKTERDIQVIRDELEAEFLSQLGLAPRQQDSPKCFAASWRQFERWSVLHNQLVQSGLDVSQGTYATSTLGEVVTLVQYGSNTKANSEAIGCPIIRMNNLVSGELDLSDLKHVEISDAERKRLLLKDGDILVNRTNSKELVGKCAVFHERDEYVFASYLIRMNADAHRANPDYLALVLGSAIGRRQIDTLSRQIGGQANINSQELRSIEVPVPPLSAQSQMAGRAAAQRRRIAALRATISSKKAQIASEVQTMILAAGCK